MDFICSDAITKARLKSSVQFAANQSIIILGEAYRLRDLLKGDNKLACYVEKIVIKNGNTYYQTNTEPGKIHSVNALTDYGGMTTTEFYAPSYLNSLTISYSNPQFLTLEQTVIKTEKSYQHFTVAEHFTNKIYFIACDSLAEGGFLYAADISEGAKQVLAEKVIKIPVKFTALAVDQLTGDIMLACGTTFMVLQKLPYLPQMMASAGVSHSK